MTALTMPARPEEDTSPRPVPWRQMAWVTWRQHRAALVGVAAFLGALAVCLWIIGLQVHHAYAAAFACRPVGSPACDDRQTGLTTHFNEMDGFLANGSVLQAVPALIGAFVGAPVLARELETGTFRYAWTQGFGRWRWTLGKLVPLTVAVAAAAGALSVLLSWYYQPYFAAGNQPLSIVEDSPLAANLFGLRGVAFAAWTLAAFSIGALAGMLIRRVVPAIAATLAAYAGLAFAAGVYLREHYLTPLLTSDPNVPGSAWIYSQWWTKGGTTLSQSTMNQVINSTFQRIAPPVVNSRAQKQQTLLNVEQYLTQHGYTYWTRYQPASRFWPFQWIEGGWLLALSALLIAVTVWLVRRRAA
jgi:ABC-type transport system involved in multi-copper enzyme maturation permease subunit